VIVIGSSADCKAAAKNKYDAFLVCQEATCDNDFTGIYRAMHFSAKRGIAIACRLSVRLSVCDVGEL